MLYFYVQALPRDDQDRHMLEVRQNVRKKKKISELTAFYCRKRMKNLLLLRQATSVLSNLGVSFDRYTCLLFASVEI